MPGLRFMRMVRLVIDGNMGESEYRSAPTFDATTCGIDLLDTSFSERKSLRLVASRAAPLHKRRTFRLSRCFFQIDVIFL